MKCPSIKASKNKARSQSRGYIDGFECAVCMVFELTVDSTKAPIAFELAERSSTDRSENGATASVAPAATPAKRLRNCPRKGRKKHKNHQRVN